MFTDNLNALRAAVVVAMVVVIGYALVSDVTQAQKTCNTPADCNTSCLGYIEPPVTNRSQRTHQTDTVYKSGSASKQCGVTKVWNNPTCSGLPVRQFNAYINDACN